MKTFMRAGFAMAVAACLSAAGCQSPTMHQLASTHALQLENVSEPLPMRLLHRAPNDDAATLRIYISGDGVPWRDGQPTDNPTGSRLPLGLKLFLRDPAAHAHIGRPCYHFRDALPQSCTSTLWTSHRYSEAIVAAITEQVRLLALRYDRQRIELVGHSGGGALALLVSERISGVERVVTVAALLDPDAWVTFHRLLPLSGSLSPLSRDRVYKFKEVHFMGEDDAIVPPALAHNYQRHYPHAIVNIVEGFDHRCCWESYWPGLLQRADQAEIQIIQARQ